MTYKFRVEINGNYEVFETLPEALKFIENNWKPGLETLFCQIRLFSERNVITERGFQIGKM